MNVQHDFPVLNRRIDGTPLIYLDSAATSLKPQMVIDAVTSYYTNFTANIHRGRHILSEEASDRYEEARYKVALLAGCASNEVIFVRNTTEALHLAAEILAPGKDDLVIGFLDSHHSQMLPWMRRGKLELVAHLADGQIDLDHFQSLLKRGPKVVALTHCSNVSGMYQPIEQLCAMAREAGARVVIDVAQSIAHKRINFSALGADFIAFSAHKMMGPSGIGCLIGKAELLAAAEPVILGGGTVDFVTQQSWQLRKIPHRFEAGTPAIEAAFGLGAAVDYIDMLGYDNIQRHEQALTSTLLTEVGKRPWMTLIGAANQNRAPIASLAIDGIPNLNDISRSLSDSYGVMCRSGHLCAQPLVDSQTDNEVIRVSAYLYNTVQEIETAFQALDEIVPGYRRQARRA